MSHPRVNTLRLLEIAEQGQITWEMIARTALGYMSDPEVEDMAITNEFWSIGDEPFFDDEAEDSADSAMNDYNYLGSRYHF